MRTSRIFRPLPSGKGFFVGKAAAFAALAMLSAVPAQAANVTVNFGVSAGTHAPAAACALSVPAGSDGEVVLSAAKAKGCIVSYRVQRHPSFGAFVSCINEVCGEPATGFSLTYWRFFVDGAPAPYGVSDYSARNGGEVVFAYTTWAGCFVSQDPAIC